MSIKQFQQELSKGFTSNIYLFHSSESFLLYDALSAIKDTYASSGAFNFDVFDAKSPDDTKPVEQIVDLLNTMPFLSDRRTVIINNAQKLSKKDVKKMEPYLSDPCTSSLLIMLYEGTAPKLFEPNSLQGVKSIALTVYEKDIPLWIKATAKRKGIDLTPEAIEYLMAFAGTDLGMLYSEIEKFSTWDNTHKILGIDDIKGMVYAGAEYNGFDLVNAITKGDVKNAFRVFENVSKATASEMLLGAINWQFIKMSASIKSSGASGEKYLSRAFSLLHEADVAVKTSRSYPMEELIVKLIRCKR